MKTLKEQIREIIESYCEGISHLEFSREDFPEMLDRIEKAAAKDIFPTNKF